METVALSKLSEAARAPEPCESDDRKRELQENLKQEMEKHISEGRASVQRNQERMSRICELKEELQREEVRLKEAQYNQSDDTSTFDSQRDYERLLERRKRLREAHERLLEEELMKMERELQAEQVQVGGAEGELSYLRRERQVLLQQMEALRRENLQADKELEHQSHLHGFQMDQLREQSLQVFRAFREVLEEQRRSSESRYRRLLLEAVQDAVHLSSQNLQLQEEIQQLRGDLQLSKQK